ncbi:MAG: nucleoside-diphosphate sugar epimerase/dehydratase [Acidobacteriota bacterium]|nr:MAG: polysaccharide biosynthesis protein [Acidobacteriota bacterium]
MMRRRLQPGWVILAKMTTDAVICGGSLLAAFAFRFGAGLGQEQLDLALRALPLAIVTKLVFFAALGTYGTLWRYSSVNDMFRLIRATFFATLALFTLLYVVGLRVPSGVMIVDFVFTLVAAGLVRLAPRIVRERMGQGPLAYLPDPLRRLLSSGSPGSSERRILVVGAGDAGENLVREMVRNERLGMFPVGFVDDDPLKKGLRIHGVKVRGTRHDIPRLVEQHQVDEILIAIPSATAEDIRPIVDIARDTKARIKILPDLASLVHGSPRLSDVRDLRIEDLLGRPRIELDTPRVAAYVEGRRVLVTGAGGSIGSELCRQLLRFRPAELILFGRGENSIFAIANELAPRAGETRLVQVIGDVINKRKLEGVFERCRPEIVFHAGADKHVPLMELNPDEAVLNNVLGTRNVLEVCNDFEVEKVVCISTDKAVNPTSIMGCCKRVAELYIQSGRYPKTCVTAVRFGNVLGSRGSVIPVFQKQIARGGPVTVTHREVRRYFMTIPEAVALVIQAGAMARAGEIFVLDMGEPVKIDDLARRIIRLHGLEPERDIPVIYTGLRPGEKLDEELVGTREDRQETDHPKIFKVARAAEVPDDLDRLVDELIRQAVAMDDTGIRRTLRRIVPEYVPYTPPEVETWTAESER